MQVPRATARSGSSATWNGMLTFSVRRLSRPRSRAPPPLRKELRRSLLEDLLDGGLQAGDGLVQAVGDFLVGDESLDRVAGHQVRTPHEERFGLGVQLGQDGTHGDLDLLRRGLAHADDVLLAQVVLDVGREDVAGHADGILLDDAAQGDDGDLGGAASDVDDR